MKIRLAGVAAESIVDGPGIRYTVFTQGCTHQCPGCHNPGTHDPSAGYSADINELAAAIRKNPLLRGVTFSGGEPFLQPYPLIELADEVRAMGKDVITYTGYTFEYLLSQLDNKPEWRTLLLASDLLIDGPFLEAQKSLLLRFRGSSNQRFILPIPSLRAGHAIESTHPELTGGESFY